MNAKRLPLQFGLRHLLGAIFVIALLCGAYLVHAALAVAVLGLIAFQSADNFDGAISGAVFLLGVLLLACAFWLSLPQVY